jgi:hypothetical protein
MFFKNFLHKPEKIFLFFLIFILLYSLVNSSYSVIWKFLLADHNIVLFSDFRCVQQWAGLYKVFFSESSIVYSHITDCILNHPRLWILLSKLFFLENEYFFLFFIINFILIYILIFFYSIKKFKSFFLLYFFFSGASLLLMERGNNDLVIFIIIFLSLNLNNLLFNYFLFLCAVFLKIYPLFGFFSFFNKFKKINIIFFSILPIIFYFFVTYLDIYNIFSNTPKSAGNSYGTLTIQLNLLKYLYLEFKFAYLSVFLLLLSLFIYIIFKRSIFSNLRISEENYFLMGSGVYICTFLISSNFDYRLVFLFFCIPALIQLNNKILKNISLISICISSELYRLVYIFGFYGGVLNSLFKVILFILLACITLEIALRRIKKL